jgi:hypothetical protein
MATTTGNLGSFGPELEKAYRTATGVKVNPAQTPAPVLPPSVAAKQVVTPPALVVPEPVSIPDMATGRAEFDLPTGYLDAQGNLFTRVVVRELLGYEEDILGDQNLSAHTRMSKMLVGCIEELGPIKDKSTLEKVFEELTPTDRMKTLVMVRVASLGPKYDFEVTCPHCERKQPHAVNLMDFKFVGIKDPKQRTYDVTLPSGVKAKVKIPTGHEEGLMEKMDPQDTASLVMMLQMTELEGKAPTLEDVKKMRYKDRIALRKKMAEIQGGMEREITVSCRNPKCLKEFSTRLNLGTLSFLLGEVS